MPREKGAAATSNEPSRALAQKKNARVLCTPMDLWYRSRFRISKVGFGPVLHGCYTPMGFQGRPRFCRPTRDRAIVSTTRGRALTSPSTEKTTRCGSRCCLRSVKITVAEGILESTSCAWASLKSAGTAKSTSVSCFTLSLFPPWKVVVGGGQFNFGSGALLLESKKATSKKMRIKCGSNEADKSKHDRLC